MHSSKHNVQSSLPWLFPKDFVFKCKKCHATFKNSFDFKLPLPFLIFVWPPCSKELLAGFHTSLRAALFIHNAQRVFAATPQKDLSMLRCVVFFVEQIFNRRSGQEIVVLWRDWTISSTRWAMARLFNWGEGANSKNDSVFTASFHFSLTHKTGRPRIEMDKLWVKMFSRQVHQLYFWKYFSFLSCSQGVLLNLLFSLQWESGWGVGGSPPFPPPALSLTREKGLSVPDALNSPQKI